MIKQLVKRKILSGSREFRLFWDNSEPFKYALTSSDYPPVLLQEEEWLFSNDIVALLKELMQFNQQKMKVVKAPFRSDNKAVLRPGDLSAWQIVNFPEEWNGIESGFFVPEGHLTGAVMEKVSETDHVDASAVEKAFFICLEQEISKMGYTLFKPVKGAKRASIQAYLKEWEQDEDDAGLL